MSARKGRLSLIPLAAAFFFTVSGGPYGLEPTLGGGFGVGLLLILVTPLVWAVPAALMTAELASAIPVEGGYYEWVRRAFGDRWGALCAWWTWLYSWVDVAIYPVLFATYLDTLSGGRLSDPWAKWGAGLIVIVPLTLVNLRGALPVGRLAVALGAFLLAPFVVFIAFGVPLLARDPGAAVRPFVASGQTTTGALGAGLFVVMWNYLGWDSLSTVAGEVEDPRRNFPRAIALALPVIVAVYLLPAAVGAVALPRPEAWKEGAWSPAADALVGGRWLGRWLDVAGLAGAAGLFGATLLAASRLPFVLARDGYLPAGLARVSGRGVPARAILVSAAFYTVFSFSTFERLAVVDVVLYSAALLLELAALARLRRTEPDLPRPFRIGGGRWGLAWVVLAPTAVVVFGLVGQFSEEGWPALGMSAVALASGAWVWRRRGTAPPSPGVP